MFLVVYGIQIKKHFIVPTSWVQDLKFKNHVNRSLNKNQKYRCFYSSHGLINEVPQENYQPNFGAAITFEFPCNEGCFTCYLVYFSGKLTKNF